MDGEADGMASRITAYLRNNVLGLIAIFIALGAGAYAAGLPKNSVKSKQIKAGAVKNAELAVNAVTSPKVADGSLLGEDFAPGQLQPGPQGPPGPPGPSTGPAGGDLTGDYPNPQITADAVGSAEVIANSLSGADIDESTLTGGGDVSGNLSDLQIAPGTISRSELASGGPHAVFSDFEYSIPANGCHIKALAFAAANLGEVFLAFPESLDLGTGVFLRPTVVAHPGQVIFEICNSTGSPVTIPFGTFFQIRLIG